MIKRLSPPDTRLFRAMLDLFGEVFAEPRTYCAAQPSDGYIHTILSDSTIIPLVAIDGDRVVGALVAYVLRKVEQERSEIHIYDLAVAQDMRRRGIATALIETLYPIAAETGAWVIFVQADRGDDPAIALYSKLGRREDILHFDITPAGSPK